MDGLILRNVTEDDHARVLAVMVDWQGPPPSVLKIFFRHFRDSSFMINVGDELAGFLVGFLSQSEKDQAYIHFAGVAPGTGGRIWGEGCMKGFIR